MNRIARFDGRALTRRPFSSFWLAVFVIAACRRAPTISDAVAKAPIKKSLLERYPIHRGSTLRDDLQTKVVQLLDAGTKHVWIVRLTGPKRVDVHRSNEPAFTVPLGETLTAEGVLALPEPVDAFFDDDARTRSRCAISSHVMDTTPSSACAMTLTQKA